MISIVVPCYNEEQAIPSFYDETTKIIAQIDADFEFIFVDDGSRDQTLPVIKSLPPKLRCTVQYISFSRNFGKEAALLAGLEAATGDYVCIMDVDLQDPPELLLDMYRILCEGEYDCVATKSVSRHGYSPLRKGFTKLYYALINRMSKTEIVTGARDFRMMTRSMVNAILQLQEHNRFCKGIFSWVGFNTKWLTFENKLRVHGTTKWNFFSLSAYAIESMVSFSTMPLMLAFFFSFLLLAAAFVLCIILVIKAIGGSAVMGLGILCALFLVGGIQTGCLAILSLYFSKAYLEIKNRPVYIIKETNINKTLTPTTDQKEASHEIIT
ncbi:MAG: glycosyltransferase family 2 protein [Clostridiales bacterium]|nr:glycosyltransferase family 2 protein [Clostridiales bacterium]